MLFTIQYRSLLHDKDDIQGIGTQEIPWEIVEHSSEIIAVHTSLCLFPWEDDRTTIVSECIWEGIRDETIRKERLLFL